MLSIIFFYLMHHREYTNKEDKVSHPFFIQNIQLANVDDQKI